jgi:saccharopine dehydrogenase-like NADP-dependent oxidoreductase
LQCSDWLVTYQGGVIEVSAVHILVVGGYGHVGGQVTEILASAGYAIRVAGRSIEKAKRFAADVGAQGVFLRMMLRVGMRP